MNFAEGYVPSTSATTGERRHQGLLERVENSFSRLRRITIVRGADFELPFLDDLHVLRRRFFSSTAPPRGAVLLETSGEGVGQRREQRRRLRRLRLLHLRTARPIPFTYSPLCVLLGLGAKSAFVATGLFGERGQSRFGAYWASGSPCRSFRGHAVRELRH
jgi:hypothetical protein